MPAWTTNCVVDPAAIETTRDAFHRGRFHLTQPKVGHHRSGLDAMLLAATVPGAFSGTVADLGAGAGAAALAVLARCSGARALLVERDPIMAECARRTLADERNAALSDRADLLAADVTLAGEARVAAGLPRERFEQVIANPPFNDVRDRQTPDPSKAAAHVIDADGLTAWIKTAAAIARPGGCFSLIVRPSMLGVVVSALTGRFGGLALRPVHARADQPAIRLLVAGTKGSRARLAMLPPVILHPPGNQNTFTPEADALINGQADLSMQA